MHGCQEKKAKCEGGSPPEGAQVRKQKIQDMVDSDLKEIEPPTPKKKQTEEAPKVGPSKGKERAHLEPEPEPEVEKAQPKKIAVTEGSLDMRDLLLRVLQEVSACQSEIRKLWPDTASLQEEMSELQEELWKSSVEEALLRMEIRKLDDFRNQAGAVQAYFTRFKLDEVPELRKEVDAKETESAEEQEESGKGPEKEGEGEGSGKSPEGSDGQESGKEPEKPGKGSGKGLEGQGPKK